MLRRLNTWLLAASAIALLVCFWNRNDVPGSIDFDARLADEPTQRPTSREPETLNYAGTDYEVDPLYDYELFGLVVSFRQHDGEDSMHRWSNDHLNMADICVIWGDSAKSEHLGKLKFWNGVFTCNVQTRDSEAWANFDIYELANNHLISADPRIRDRVAQVRVGDQIRIKGSLARYGATSTGLLRGTSTTRKDTGDGACETILVEEFAIVERSFSRWRAGLILSLVLLAIGLAIHFAMPYRPYGD
jgi:hypothetical protein